MEMPPNTRRRVTMICGAIVLALAACGGGSGTKAKSSAAPTSRVRSDGPPSTTAKAASRQPHVTDACSLLTLDQVRALIADALEGKPKSQSAAAASEVSCYYGSTATDNGLTVSFETTNSPDEQLKLSLQSEGRGDGAEQVPGLGDFAIVVTMPINVEVKALFGSSVLIVNLNGTDAQARKAQVIDLAKQAAAKL